MDFNKRQLNLFSAKVEVKNNKFKYSKICGNSLQSYLSCNNTSILSAKKILWLDKICYKD